MNPSPPQKSRLQLVREQAARGQPRDDAIQRTRLVVSIDRVAEDPNNERKTSSHIEEMVASVKAHGIIEPITVVALGDGRYQIVTGHRRYRAAKLAGLGQVEILVRQQTPSTGAVSRASSRTSSAKASRRLNSPWPSRL